MNGTNETYYQISEPVDFLLFLKNELSKPNLEVLDTVVPEVDIVADSVIVIDYIICSMAILLNFIVLLGVIRAGLFLKGYRNFLICLIISDILASAVNMANTTLQNSRFSFNAGMTQYCWYQIFRSFKIVSLNVNILTLCTMSVDHYIGILHPFKYATIMKSRNIWIIMAAIWVFSVVFGFSDHVISEIVEKETDRNVNLMLAVESLLNNDTISDHQYIDILGSSGHSEADDCIFGISKWNYLLEAAVATLGTICFLVLAVIYGRIAYKVCIVKHLPRMKMRRLVLTTIFLLTAFFIAWIPGAIYNAFMTVLIYHNDAETSTYYDHLFVHKVFDSIRCAYPLMDPIIYAARLASVRSALVSFIGKTVVIGKADNEYRLSSFLRPSIQSINMRRRQSSMAYVPERTIYEDLISIDDSRIQDETFDI